MIFLKKILAFIKNYWYIPFVILAFVIGFFSFYFAEGGIKRFKNILYAAKARYKKDSRKIEETHKRKEQKKKQTVIKHSEDVKKAGKDKENAISELEKDKQQSIKNKTERYNENPDSFTKEISELFNFSIFSNNDPGTTGRTRDQKEALHKESEEGGEGPI